MTTGTSPDLQTGVQEDPATSTGNLSKVTSRRVEQISEPGRLFIEATTGERTISSATRYFSCIGKGFEHYSINVPADPTEKMKIGVYRSLFDGTFRDIFEYFSRFLSSGLNGLCLTQDQFLSTVEVRPSLLRSEGFATLSLLRTPSKFRPKVGDIRKELFVADVRVNRVGKYEVAKYSFDDTWMWHAEKLHHFVMPEFVIT